ncbi:MAG TPA: DUF2127 domain-containing protein [Solirubrobacteraceae bacterium]|jgi:uncharacterized membrane protein (DUF2068 family)|nr:DUF2127 domain-containing protein [Solirubrobacteraceae bacterium]
MTQATAPTTAQDPPADGPANDRLLPWIAAERSVRAVLLVAIGLVLITHPHTDWGRTITRFTQDLGFDPSNNGIQRLIAKVRAISPDKYTIFGLIAIAYGILEGVEGYGLWHRRAWAEYLTVAATSLLFIPEIIEIAKTPTALKIGALLVNLAVVVYLIYRLRRRGG